MTLICAKFDANPINISIEWSAVWPTRWFAVGLINKHLHWMRSMWTGTSDEDGKSTETDCAHQARSGKQGLQHGTGSLNHSHSRTTPVRYHSDCGCYSNGLLTIGLQRRFGCFIILLASHQIFLLSSKILPHSTNSRAYNKMYEQLLRL